MILELVDIVLIVVLAAAASATVLVFVRFRLAEPADTASPKPDETILLFEGHQLLDATGAGHALLAQNSNATDWGNLVSVLGQRFPVLRELDASNIKAQTLRASDGAELVIEKIETRHRVSLRDPDQFRFHSAGYLHHQRRNRRELGVLRQVMQNTPFPAWKTDADGTLLWRNKAYETLLDAIHPTADPAQTTLFPYAAINHRARCTTRVSVETPGGAKKWYEVTCANAGAERLFYASNIDSTIQAEIAQREFFQTLSRTFAQLSTGLALFDSQRRLIMFNPALVDLLNVPIDFLSGKPTLSSFFDRLRNDRLMPEPKNYSNWREHVNTLVKEASAGSFAETWEMPDGGTYRVKGKPHLDGAVAFLFEDVSAEIATVRKYRTELDLGAAILNMVDQAIAVFSRNGDLVTSNSAYRALWHVDPDTDFAGQGVVEATKLWASQCEPSPLWSEIRDFVASEGERGAWDGTVTQSNGLRLNCLVKPIPKNATLVSFHEDNVAAPLELKRASSG